MLWLSSTILTHNTSLEPGLAMTGVIITIQNRCDNKHTKYNKTAGKEDCWKGEERKTVMATQMTSCIILLYILFIICIYYPYRRTQNKMLCSVCDYIPYILTSWNWGTFFGSVLQSLIGLPYQPQVQSALAGNLSTAGIKF